MENQNQIIFSPDYRSPPSGLGTINLNEDLILIQATDGDPRVKEGVYSHIYQLGSVNEDHDLETHEKLMTLLRTLDVTHVYDPETAYNMPCEDTRWPGETFKLDLWDTIVREGL